MTKQVKPSSGNIFCNDEDISCITNERLGILYLSDKPTFFENKSVLCNTEYPLKVRKLSKDERKCRALEVLSKLAITDVDVKISKLNERERKLAAIARGLTVPRQIVMFDDFFEEDDDADEIVRLFDAQINIILTSDVRLARGNNAVVLDGGYTAYQGDTVNAVECVRKLNWLYDELRRENGK